MQREDKGFDEDMEELEWPEEPVEEKVLPCPVCGKPAFPEIGAWRFCDNCDWQDDKYQAEFPDERIGANCISLNDARRAYKKGIPLMKAIEAYHEGKLEELLGK